VSVIYREVCLCAKCTARLNWINGRIRERIGREWMSRIGYEMEKREQGEQRDEER